MSGTGRFWGDSSIITSSGNSKGRVYVDVTSANFDPNTGKTDVWYNVGFHVDYGNFRGTVMRSNYGAYITVRGSGDYEYAHQVHKVLGPRDWIYFQESVSYTGGSRKHYYSGAYFYWYPNAPRYTVTYNANGGTNPPQNTEKVWGDGAVISNIPPKRPNYDFVEWNTKADGTGEHIKLGEAWSSNRNLTLYAIWKKSYNSPVLSFIKCERMSTGKRLSLGVSWSIDTTMAPGNTPGQLIIRFRKLGTTTWTNAYTATPSSLVGSVMVNPDDTISTQADYEVQAYISDTYGPAHGIPEDQYKTTITAKIKRYGDFDDPSMDWKDLRRQGELHFYMVSPQNIDHVLGELEGVDLNGSSLTSAYYTDTRGNGTLKVVGDSWIPGSFVRVVYQIPEWDWQRELGTYIVTSDKANRKNGIWTTTLTLATMLQTLAEDITGDFWTIAEGASVKNSLKQIMEARGAKYLDKGANDITATSTLTLDPGCSQLEKLYALAEVSGNRLDVNGHGVITMSKYVLPARKMPIFEISLDDPRGLSQDDLERESDWLTIPNRAAVSYKWTETVDNKSVEHHISAYVDLPNSSKYSIPSRGYVVTDFKQLNELEPKTYARASEIARQNLESKKVLNEWTLTMQYLPIWEGDTVDLIVKDGQEQFRGTRHCLVKSLDLDLGDMTMQLVLKETASGDEE